MLYISRDSAGVRGVREKGKDYKAYQHLGEQSSKYHSQWLFKMGEKNKTKQNKNQKKKMQNWGFHLPLQTIMYKVVFSVKHFIWMSKSIIFTDKDQLFTMDIPTEGAQKTVNSKRWQHWKLYSSWKPMIESGLSVNAQLVELLQSPVAQYPNPQLGAAHVPKALVTSKMGLLDLYHPSKAKHIVVREWPDGAVQQFMVCS